MILKGAGQKERAEETSGGDVHYLDCGNGFTSICRMFEPIILLYKMCTIIFVYQLHVKPVKKCNF